MYCKHVPQFVCILLYISLHIYRYNLNVNVYCIRPMHLNCGGHTPNSPIYIHLVYILQHQTWNNNRPNWKQKEKKSQSMLRKDAQSQSEMNDVAINYDKIICHVLCAKFANNPIFSCVCAHRGWILRNDSFFFQNRVLKYMATRNLLLLNETKKNVGTNEWNRKREEHAE